MRILITGITGFVGSHLTAALHREGTHSIHGLSRTARWGSAVERLEYSATLHAVDLHDGPSLEKLLRELQPDWLFHLAGFAHAGRSAKEPDKCWRDNVDATRTLYDSVLRCGITPRILFTSTGLIYGDPDVPGEALNESSVLKPVSPYATSKAAADLLGHQYAKAQGLDIVRVRLFNQIGPGQSPDYAIANFARQIAAIDAGKQKPVLETGDLSAERDLTDVRDIVSACRLLIEKGQAGEAYNAGFGRTWRIGAVLEKLIAMGNVPVEVKVTLDPTRKAETAVSRADTAKIRQATGWVPKFTLEETLHDILEFWRRHP